MDGLLVTFGCSWVYGVGASYRPGIMSKDEFLGIATREEYNIDYCFRTFLSKKYNLENKNFAIGGSSNQTQFRLAQEFFISDQFEDYRKKYKNIIVAWGLTSTTRMEFYCQVRKRLATFSLTNTREHRRGIELCRLLISDFYDHDTEVERLYTQMKHWNQYFKSIGVKNIWFDLFNHHKYPGKIENLCFEDDFPRDFLSKIILYKRDDGYHKSTWFADCARTELGVACGVLNPHTLHPVQESHKSISEMLSPFIEERLS